MSGTTKGLQLHSLIKESGELELSLAEVPIPEPGPDQVLVKVEATPINPSDLGLLLGPADMSTAKASGSGAAIKITAKVPEQALPFIAARLDQAMPVGNEGAGTVVKAGSSEAAQALLGKTVSMIGGAMYAQYRLLKATDCLPLPAGTTAAEGASWFVNPLTALGMVETMKREGHKALVHTAAASNLGQMLNKICQRGRHRPGEHRAQRRAGEAAARHRREARRQFDLGHLHRGADAGAGRDRRHDRVRRHRRRQARQPDPDCMEVALNKTAKEYSRYGSTTHKQVYIYGSLDTAPAELTRNFGMAWGVGGWLLTPFLQKIGRSEQVRLRERVVKS